jgi:hypothetical protein
LRVISGGPLSASVEFVSTAVPAERRDFGRFVAGVFSPGRAGVLPLWVGGVRLLVGASRGRVEVQMSGARGLPRDVAL